MNRPTKATRAGQAFLALRGEANSARRATAEYLRLYALEGFLLRLAASPHRDRFVLKGGVLLAAYDLRRPTADVDLAALATPNEVEPVRNLVAAIAATLLPADSDDGLTFDLSDVRARPSEKAIGTAACASVWSPALATAREPFHVDVNVGDPIWPGPVEVFLPRLLAADPIHLRGYPMEMVLAEKIVTALQRGQASTRWRDFGDIYQVTGRRSFRAGDIRRTLQAVADFRRVALPTLDELLDGYAAIGQPRWAPWRAKLQLTGLLPVEFANVLDALRAFANPILSGSVVDTATWDPDSRMWQSS